MSLNHSIGRPPSVHAARIAAAANRLPPRQASVVVAAMLAAIGAVDLASGGVIALFPFYAATVAFAAWRFGAVAGIMVVLSVAILGLPAHGTAEMALSPFVRAWNVAASTAGGVILALLAAAVRSAIEHERARASTDWLTGVLNRAAFLARLDAGRGDPTRLLVCIDLDGFKAVNDRHGHAEGDRLLREFACGVAATLGDGEAIARMGGDEFALLLSIETGEDAGGRAGRAHRLLADRLALHGHDVTASAGAVPLTIGADCDRLLAAADALMYEAKHRGGNAIVMGRGAATVETGAPCRRPALVRAA